MGSSRKLHARLFRCGVFCMVVFACGGNTAAQSRPSKSPNSLHPATQRKPAERADVGRFSQRVEKALSASGPDKGFWGVLITDAATGEILYARNAGNYFTPASDAKLFTTALALATLGPEYRVRTTISTTGTLDANGVLNGDLVLTGRGDANLSNRKFPYEKKIERDGSPEKALAALADAVAAGGVKEIEGGVVADDSLFQLERFPSGWTVDDMLWSYGAAVSAIAVNDNTFTVDLRAGEREGDAATFTVEPAGDFYTIVNSVRTSPRGSEEKPAVVREPGSRLVRLSGSLPVGAQPRHLTIAIEEPAEYAAALLARLLEARGVQIHGAARARHSGDPALSGANGSTETILAGRTSEPLAEEIRHVNKNSLNLHAELLLLLAAHEKAGATTREDAVNFASTQSWGDIYRSSLPVAGEDGTLSDRMKNTAAAGRIFAKTGTVEHVVALSGYATTTRGAQLIFSILGNNNSLHAQTADAVLDAIAVAMIEELGPAPAKKRKK